MDKMGGYAEYTTVNESELALMPKNVDFIKAASLPVAGITAAEGILDLADVQAGQLVLVHAAAGGVGSIAIQLAKVRGAKVIGTASKHNHEFLKELVVDLVIDYCSQKFEDCVKNVDVVFDGVGGATQKRSYKVLRKGGVLISITTVPDAHLAKLYSVKASHVWANPSHRLLGIISKLVDSDLVKPVVTYTFPLGQVQKAHKLSEGGHLRGKIVLIP
ncbi:MAG: NADP-dependent oxidoreductase [Cytophagales bacterium]|nr:NADP-dependent oxidoreductase [Cytophagales bacterium]